jgi:hypothetical protein
MSSSFPHFVDAQGFLASDIRTEFAKDEAPWGVESLRTRTLRPGPKKF